MILRVKLISDSPTAVVAMQPHRLRSPQNCLEISQDISFFHLIGFVLSNNQKPIELYGLG
jgi:hypothetical protein